MLDLLLGEYCILNQGRKRPSVIVLQIQVLNPFSARLVGELRKQLYNLIIRKCESKKKQTPEIRRQVESKWLESESFQRNPHLETEMLKSAFERCHLIPSAFKLS